MGSEAVGMLCPACTCIRSHKGHARPLGPEMTEALTLYGGSVRSRPEWVVLTLVCQLQGTVPVSRCDVARVCYGSADCRWG